MATEYKLSYPAAQINEKLGKIVDLDTTLTNEGEAADSKATGDALNQLKDDLANKVPKTDYAPEAKTDAMTQPVGKDENGKLWTAPGSDGAPGYTPVKGVDYFTESDKTELVNAVLAALPMWEGGSY